jgi:hypothetical protein
MLIDAGATLNDPVLEALLLDDDLALRRALNTNEESRHYLYARRYGIQRRMVPAWKWHIESGGRQRSRRCGG